MSRTLRWTVSDLELLPENDKRYEIIDGELHVAKQPDWFHQMVCGRLFSALDAWDHHAGLGMASLAPGVIFTAENAVAPDLAWATRDRLRALDGSGHLHVAPDLVVEVLSPGSKNQQRDREAKLKLYSQHGVQEYWIVDWRLRQVEVYRRQDFILDLVATLLDADVLVSPLLPGFELRIDRLFEGIPV